MFSSISRIFTGHTPSKHSSPGPQRPDVEETIDRTFPSTAPAEYPDGIDDRQLARMASQDWDRDAGLNLLDASDNDEAFDDEVHDGITDDYVDPFASMQPFSTQAVLDEDVITAPTYASSDDATVKKKKAKKGKKSDEKKTRTKKGKSKAKSSDLEEPRLPLPTPITSGPTSHSAAEEAIVTDGEAHDEQDAVAHQQKKRKRKARNEVDSSEGQDPTRQKKRKRRTALEDIQDVDMDSQPEESVPESPVQPVANSTKVQSPDYQPDPAPDSTLKSEPQRSQLLGVSRQLFSQPSGTPAVDASDDDDAVSMSSPSVAAQRRRSMSRGSQISVLRQSLAREAASQSAPSSQAAESSDEAPPEHEEGELEFDAGSLADNLPPSSQPPREDTPSSDEAGADVTQEPQLPIKTFRDTWNDLNDKNTGNQKLNATPRTTRRRAVEAGAGISETGNLLSSAQKSSRSTASKRQRSKPDFFENPPQERDAGKDQDDTGNQDAVDKHTEKSLAALTEPPSTEVAEPPKKQKKKTQRPAASRASTTADTATPKTKAGKKAASLQAASRQAAGQFVTGQFSIDEMRTLTQAVEKYRDDHGLSQKEMNDLIQMKSYKRGGGQKPKSVGFDSERFLSLWAAICATLPNRRRQKVIDVARQEFHNFAARGGGWNDREDARLEELHTKYNGSWVKIAGEMNRHPNDVRDRYRNYVICGGIERWQKWTEEEERELVEHVVGSLRRIQRIPGNRNKEPLSLINWQSISELMGHRRSRLQCMKKFKKLNVEVGPRDVLQSSQADSKVTWALEKARKQIREMPPEAKYELVSAILAGAAGRDQDIRWSKLVDVPFRRKWARPTLKLLWHRLKQQVPGYEGKTVRDCARWLLEDAEANNPRDARFLDGGHADGDSEDESMVVDPPKKTVGRRAKKAKNRSEEMVVDSGGSDDDDETRVTNLDSPSAQQQPSSAAASQRTTPFAVCSPEGSPQTSPSLPPAVSQDKFRLAPTETGGVKPSPAKRRIRLSGGKSARQRSMEEDGGSPERMGSQYAAAEDIPDRLKEKRESARRRISSGSRLRSTASLQPESVQNSDVDEDMPPIHVPPPTQTQTRKRNMFKLSQGNWARKTGASVLPGEAIESMEGTDRHTAQGDVDMAASTPVGKPREAKRRRMNREVAESPA
ncbi:myb-like DNA-binding domain-containing protein [Colletotrichum graminicola]|uniref:Myb-like DNA-binding domain-containing protein n=1 Tax=Colletotrichum graminicola (strain M1.001 / M2 / FGSC 10212) TaxID=645133 RepID=E3QTE0_COLGM|nr:myb-like DNA-binding domain-containing protein [Colletotrichum graminicola M1.001]EFQ34128.1 myb-like DNA-binding domain-containing protein [Colletotrichum graminicola M1.001]WDK18436.1 myb-like DNA-binding domain-containing protein [Colletotrichum graminicola]